MDDPCGAAREKCDRGLCRGFAEGSAMHEMRGEINESIGWRGREDNRSSSDLRQWRASGADHGGFAVSRGVSRLSLGLSETSSTGKGEVRMEGKTGVARRWTRIRGKPERSERRREDARRKKEEADGEEWMSVTVEEGGGWEE
ncbi:hypothetical protein N7462_003836 [Penicillium macrosclerotiorum]|uniref:uncharacterized protein n=1 Tax=Penicillium macrosclerotiorum TaxID=303699 RepID=UPI0025490FB7|nr:uncharacterized protein N7462_003836 [Penicillium macrosclerotiorum]KAJ5689444.1 hypothetical protein N7462_003836 [Penicillium macrosclerotiorum]